MSIYDPSKANKDNWAALVEKQSKGLTPDEFTWFTRRYSHEGPLHRGGHG